MICNYGSFFQQRSHVSCFFNYVKVFLKIIFLFIIGCCQLFILNQFTRLYVEKDIVIEFEINFVLNFLSWIRAGKEPF